MEEIEYLDIFANPELGNNAISGDSDDEQLWAEEVEMLRKASSKLDVEGATLEEAHENNSEYSIFQLVSSELGEANPTKKGVFILNNFLIYLLKKMESQVLDKLRRNKEEQESLNRRHFSIYTTEPTTASYRNCGMPFFKNTNKWKQADNVYLQRHKELNYSTSELHFKMTRAWSWNDYQKLNKVVLQLSKEAEIKNLEFSLKKLQKTKADEAEIKVLLNRVIGLKEGTVSAVVNENIDWLQVSTALKCFSPQECKAAWHYSVRPTINKRKWSKDELSKLKTVAKEHNFERWDLISEELGTDRSALQCVVTYQRMPKSVRWSDEDEIKFQELVVKIKNSPRPWVKLFYFFPDRNLQNKMPLKMVLPKKTKSRKPNYIILKPNEKDLTKVLKAMLKKDNSKVYNMAMSVINCRKGFTESEDKLLLSSVTDSGDNLTALVRKFPDRQPCEVIERYAQLSNVSKEILQLIASNNSNKNSCIDYPSAVWEILQLFWTCNVGPSIVCGVNLNGSLAFRQLLRLLQFSDRNVFGPRFALPRTDDAKASLLLRLKVISEFLHTKFNPEQINNKLESDDEKFHYPPHQFVLEATKSEISCPEEEVENIGQHFIPPNFLTLVGTKVLYSARGMLTGQSMMPNFHSYTEFDETVPEENRLEPDRAKLLLKKRIKSLLYYSLIASKLECPKAVEVNHKPKIVKKPLSKLQRKRRFVEMRRKRDEKKG